MKKSLVVVLTLVLLSASLPAFAQTPTKEKQALSGRMQAIGFLAALGGGLMMFGTGENYRVLGDTFCVRERSVDYGSCTVDPMQMKIGGYLLLGGVAALAIGSIPVSRNVAVGAGLTKTGVAGRVSVKF